MKSDEMYLFTLMCGPQPCIHDYFHPHREIIILDPTRVHSKTLSRTGATPIPRPPALLLTNRMGPKFSSLPMIGSSYFNRRLAHRIHFHVNDWLLQMIGHHGTSLTNPKVPESRKATQAQANVIIFKAKPST